MYVECWRYPFVNVQALCVYILKNEMSRQRSQEEARRGPLAGKPA